MAPASLGSTLVSRLCAAAGKAKPARHIKAMIEADRRSAPRMVLSIADAGMGQSAAFGVFGAPQA